MRIAKLSLVLVALCSSGSGCTKVCGPGEAKSGDRCVTLPSKDAAADGATNPDVDARADEGQASDSSDGFDAAEPAPPCIPPECDPCDNEPCANGGTCATTADGFECSCRDGFSGPTCQLDPCEQSPCAHGTCIRTQEGRVCACTTPNWQGDACEVNTDPSLAGLVPSAGALFPAFDADVDQYSIDIGVSAPELTFTPTAAFPDGVTITIDGQSVESGVPSAPVEIGLNAEHTFEVEIVAGNQNSRRYSVLVRRTLVQQAYLPMGRAGARAGAAISPCGLSRSGLALDADELAVSGGAAGIRFYSRVGGEWIHKGFYGSAFGNENSFGRTLAMDSGWLAIGNLDGTPRVEVARLTGLFGASRRVEVVYPTPGTNAVGFGTSVALHGNFLAVGSPCELTDPDSGPEATAHAAYLYEFDGLHWELRKRIQGPAVAIYGGFGMGVAIDDELLAVGSPSEEGTAMNGSFHGGRAHVFRSMGGDWVHDGTLATPSGTYFGGSVGVSEGRVAASVLCQSILNPRCTADPVVQVYGWTAGEWQGSGPFGAAALSEAPAALLPWGFGLGGIAFQGRTLVASAYAEENVATGVNPSFEASRPAEPEVGATYVFNETAQGWKRTGYLKASNAQFNDAFGYGVAMSGDTIVVAASGEDSAATDVNGNQSDNTAEDSGAVYVFHIDCSKVPEGAVIPGC